jgi:xylogalacturonan beta-1,3-xylosyltransferase
MGDLSCTPPFLLYPSVFLILFFSFINHHFHFFFAPPLFSLSINTQGSDENPQVSLSQIPSPTRDFYNGSRRNTTSSSSTVSDTTSAARN